MWQENIYTNTQITLLRAQYTKIERKRNLDVKLWWIEVDR